MKKFVLALLAVGSVATANAQKNSILTYGTAGIFVDNTDNGPGLGDSRTVSWNVNPGIGYQFHKNLTAGIQGGYMKSTFESTTVATPGFPLDVTAIDREWQAGVFFTRNYGNGFKWNVKGEYQQRLPLNNTEMFTWAKNKDNHLTDNIPEEFTTSV